MIYFHLLACGEPAPETSTLFNIVLDEYHMLTENRSWTYRDDMPVDPESFPDESSLLLAKNDGSYVQFRRGSRWADAQDVGHIEWDPSDGFRILSWDLPFSSSDSGFLLTDANVEVDATISDGGWQAVRFGWRGSAWN